MSSKGYQQLSSAGNIHNVPATNPASERTPFFISTESDQEYRSQNGKFSIWKRRSYILIAFLLALCIVIPLLWFRSERPKGNSKHQIDTLGYEKSSVFMKPLSSENPNQLKYFTAERSEDAKPNILLSKVVNEYTALPTNSWCLSMLIGAGTTEMNRVYQIPYIVDAAGPIAGIRSHPARVQANNREVTMITEPNNALTMGSVEPLNPVYTVAGEGQKALGTLVLALDWHPLSEPENSYKVQAHIARGSPYISMIYENASPKIVAESSLLYSPIIDGVLTPTVHSDRLICGDRPGVFSPHPVRVNKNLLLRFHASDMTWIVFFSEPVDLVCSSTALDELSDIPPYFELRSVTKLTKGMVRIALVNNCTSGTNPRYCVENKPRNKDAYKQLIIDHADIYPSVNADVNIEYPKQVETGPELFHVKFNWNPRSMSAISLNEQDTGSEMPHIPRYELLLMSVVHHRELLKPMIGSSNEVFTENDVCTTSLHGLACPVTGGTWLLVDTLQPVSFGLDKAPRSDMIPDIKKALLKEIELRPPLNYQLGAGDTYFSGKILAKLSRLLLFDEGLGNFLERQVFSDALSRLRQYVQAWIDGNGISPFLYDSTWGGVMSCGCDYDYETTLCQNAYPNCPAVTNEHMNFGFSYYNDHHFHLGYHIFAAAVVAKYDPDWGEKYYENVLVLVRDIMNPSHEDPFFTPFRHMDWYLGFSWAGGIVKHDNEPFLNGRNWESSSEALSAYEGVALFGEVMSNIFYSKLQSNIFRSNSQDDYQSKYESSVRVYLFGRIITSITVRTAKTYFHVRSPDTEGVVRVYPEVFTGKVVGMMWSMLMEEQTWFGNEAWKSHGIQVLPLTSISEQRDDVDWLKEMIPIYKESCDQSTACLNEGWSVAVWTLQSRYGDYKDSWRAINALNDSVFLTAGGNGHSRVNSLWLIATWSNNN